MIKVAPRVSQGSVATYITCDGTMTRFVLQIFCWMQCWKNFENGQHMPELCTNVEWRVFGLSVYCCLMLFTLLCNCVDNFCWISLIYCKIVICLLPQFLEIWHYQLQWIYICIIIILLTSHCCADKWRVLTLLTRLFLIGRVSCVGSSSYKILVVCRAFGQNHLNASEGVTYQVVWILQTNRLAEYISFIFTVG